MRFKEETGSRRGRNWMSAMGILFIITGVVIKMGLMNRISTVISQKVSTLVDRFENPQEALDYSYTKQLEMLNKLRRSLAEIITSRKRLEMQKSRLWDNIRLLDEQARRALEGDREDLARLALERKNANLSQMQGLDKQIAEMKEEEA